MLDKTYKHDHHTHTHTQRHSHKRSKAMATAARKTLLLTGRNLQHYQEGLPYAVTGWDSVCISQIQSVVFIILFPL